MFRSSGSAQNDSVRAAATPALSHGSKGSGAPSSRRTPVALIAALALAAFLAFGAAPALAAPPTVTTPVVSGVSYASAHFTGKITTSGGLFNNTSYSFQYSKDPGTEPWSQGPSGEFKGAANGKEVFGDLKGLKGGTDYTVRLVASVLGAGFVLEEGVSPQPNPSFTTLPVVPPTIPGPIETSTVFSTSAMVTAKVKRPANGDAAFDVTACRFEYVTDEQFTTNSPGEEFSGAGQAPCVEVSPEAPITEPNEERVVTAQLTGLSPTTTYHLRLAAENAGGAATKEATSTFTTLAPVAKPTVLAADDAFEVAKRSAQATGKVERPAGADPALDASCRFEVVTDAQFKATGFAGAARTDCVPNPIASPDLGHPAVVAEVEAQLAGLEPGTTYHLRLAAENGGGTDAKDAASTFTTLPVIRPVLTVDSISEVSYLGFHVTGTIDPGNQGVTPWAIEYSPAGQEEWSDTPAYHGDGVAANLPPVSISGDLPCTLELGPPYMCQKLKPGTTYQVRVGSANGEEGTPLYSEAPYPEFTTKGTSAPPIASLDPVTTFTGTTAHFSGSVDANAPSEPLPAAVMDAYRTNWHIECTPACGKQNGTVEAGEGSKAISVNVINLEAKTLYQVKLIATNVLGSVESEQTFETPLIPPTIKNLPGASDGKGGYTLAGVVNPNNSEITSCNFEWGPNSADYAFDAPCSPMPSPGGKPTTVEAPLTGLNPGVTYHASLVVTYGAGSKAKGVDQEFVATLSPPDTCANEARRVENSSSALAECRAYEQVTSPIKAGADASRLENTDDGSVLYRSTAGNIANSGAGEILGTYVASRTSTGWETIPNLNGPFGSPTAGPDAFGGQYLSYSSADLRSSLWMGSKLSDPDSKADPYIRKPDGSFERIGKFPNIGNAVFALFLEGASDDLSHLVLEGQTNETGVQPFGRGLFEWIGTGNDQPPRRVDVDNSGNPLAPCGGADHPRFKAISSDGSVVLFTVPGGCGLEIWARVDGTSSYQVSASHCDRTPADLGGVCNAPADPLFTAATPDGSRVFFTTTQQMVNGDVDQTKDVYAYDLPTNANPNPSPGLIEVSGARGGAQVEEVAATSEDGSTVYFTSPAVLADNKDALGQAPLPGDRNLYSWRQDADHPAGQTTFVTGVSGEAGVVGTTPTGRYLILRNNSHLTDTDTDTAVDVFRYDADTGEMIRVSTNSSGVGGNSNDFDVSVGVTFTDAGDAVAFATNEPLLLALDGNGEGDVYLWRQGKTHLISTGAVGGGGSAPSIDASGQNLYFETALALTPTDGDSAVDVYDARVNGGFSAAQPPRCVGEACQAPPSGSPPASQPATSNAGSGNPSAAKPCAKNKVKKRSKCVKKPKKRGGKKHHSKKHKRGGANAGGGK
jgi:hypothetical protein